MRLLVCWIVMFSVAAEVKPSKLTFVSWVWFLCQHLPQSTTHTAIICIIHSHHSGNVKYRSLVKKYQPLYIMSKRRDKPLIASKIVRLVRHSGGRFLRKDKSNTWRDVGNTKAREKTSQALREGAPDLRGTPPKGAAPAAAVSEEVLASTLASSSTSHHPGPQKPYQVLTVRKHPGYPTGIPQYTSASSLGETRPGDHASRFFGSPPPPAKKMRFGGLPLQASGVTMPHSHLFGAGGPQHASAGQTMPGMGGPAAYGTMVSAPAPVGPTSASGSPQSFATTVSADDDDSRGSEDRSAGSPQPRGPRLKLLKKRLQDQQAEN